MNQKMGQKKTFDCFSLLTLWVGLVFFFVVCFPEVLSNSAEMEQKENEEREKQKNVVKNQQKMRLLKKQQRRKRRRQMKMFNMLPDLETVLESNDESDQSSSDSFSDENTRLIKQEEKSIKIPGYYLLNDYDELEGNSEGQESLLTDFDVDELNFTGDYIDEGDTRDLESSVSSF